MYLIVYCLQCNLRKSSDAMKSEVTAIYTVVDSKIADTHNTSP